MCGIRQDIQKYFLIVEKLTKLFYNLPMENYEKMDKYFIQTFGCQMNVHESEKIAGVLDSFGFEATDSVDDAQIVFINTCAIRENAEKKIESFIGNLKHRKLSGEIKMIGVLGCMTQQDGAGQKLLDKFPFLDIVIGTHNLPDIQRFIQNKLDGKKRQLEIVDKRLGYDIENIKRTSGINAWVNIMHGCNNFCTYCIVPYVRGREVSRPEQEILDEVENLLKEGYAQITLLGQNVNSYGNDVSDPEINFSNLLRKIDAFDYKFRLRFMTSHPKDLSDEVIDVIAESRHICHGIHLPVQSGSTAVLEKMNRKYSREHYLERVRKIKEKIPDVGLTTDIIVGFPNETDQDFEDTMSLIEEVGYQQIFGFIYSKRKGTVAEKLDGQVPALVKKQRLARLIEKEREIASRISAEQIGKDVEVLIEDISKGSLVGSTDQNKNIYLNIPAGCANPQGLVGKFVTATVVRSKLTVLYGEIKNV